MSIKGSLGRSGSAHNPLEYAASLFDFDRMFLASQPALRPGAHTMKQGSLLAALAIVVMALGMALASAGASESVLQIGVGGSDIATLDPHRATSMPCSR